MVGCVALALTTLAWPWWWGVRIAACSALGMAGVVAAQRLRQGACTVVIGADATVRMFGRDGHERAGCLCEGTYVSATVVSIVWRPEHARLARAFLVTGDMLAPDEFRRLRVMLRYARPPAAAGSNELEAG